MSKCPYTQWPVTFSYNTTLKSHDLFFPPLTVPKTFANLDLVFIEQINSNETFYPPAS